MAGLASIRSEANTCGHGSKELRLLTSAFFTRGEYEAALDVLSSGAAEPRMLVTDTIALGDVPATFKAFKRRTHQCKALIDAFA